VDQKLAHDDLTGIPASLRALDPHDLECHPVEALGRALRRYPRPAGRLAPTEVALATPASPAGVAWQQAARHAVVAQHVWTAGMRRPLDPEARWAGMADVASLADALSRLDVGLILTTVGHPRCPQLVSVLRGGLDQALGVAARETLRLASQGPLPDVGPDRAPLPSLQVAPVRAATDLPQAQQRLAVLLEHGGGLRPERFPVLAALQARACLLLADGLYGTAQPSSGLDATSVEAALHRHARVLHQATLRRSGIASIVAGDGRPLRQAGEIDRCLQRERGFVAADPVLLGAVVTGIASTTRALAATASRALESGDWLVPDQGLPRAASMWRTWRAQDPAPDSVAAIRKATADSIDLAQTVTRPTPGRAASPPRVPAATRQRPPSPSDRTAHLLRLRTGRPRLPAYSPLSAVARGR